MAGSGCSEVFGWTYYFPRARSRRNGKQTTLRNEATDNLSSKLPQTFEGYFEDLWKLTGTSSPDTRGRRLVEWNPALVGRCRADYARSDRKAGNLAEEIEDQLKADIS